jgi:hypothetical protein
MHIETPRISSSTTVSIAARYLGVLLIAMAVGQASDIAGFRSVLVDYGVGRTVGALLAGALLAAELLAGIGLNTRAARRHVAFVAFVVATAWSALALEAFARGVALENCGCFGVHLAQPLRWWVLLEDAAFVALATWVWVSARRAGRERGR